MKVVNELKCPEEKVVPSGSIVGVRKFLRDLPAGTVFRVNGGTTYLKTNSKLVCLSATYHIEYDILAFTDILTKIETFPEATLVLGKPTLAQEPV